MSDSSPKAPASWTGQYTYWELKPGRWNQPGRPPEIVLEASNRIEVRVRQWKEGGDYSYDDETTYFEDIHSAVRYVEEELVEHLGLFLDKPLEALVKPGAFSDHPDFGYAGLPGGAATRSQGGKTSHGAKAMADTVATLTEALKTERLLGLKQIADLQDRLDKAQERIEGLKDSTVVYREELLASVQEMKDELHEKARLWEGVEMAREGRGGRGSRDGKVVAGLPVNWDTEPYRWVHRVWADKEAYEEAYEVHQANVHRYTVEQGYHMAPGAWTVFQIDVDGDKEILGWDHDWHIAEDAAMWLLRAELEGKEFTNTYQAVAVKAGLEKFLKKDEERPWATNPKNSTRMIALSGNWTEIEGDIYLRLPFEGPKDCYPIRVSRREDGDFQIEDRITDVIHVYKEPMNILDLLTRLVGEHGVLHTEATWSLVEKFVDTEKTAEAGEEKMSNDVYWALDGSALGVFDPDIPRCIYRISCMESAEPPAWFIMRTSRGVDTTALDLSAIPYASQEEAAAFLQKGIRADHGTLWTFTNHYNDILNPLKEGTMDTNDEGTGMLGSLMNDATISMVWEGLSEGSLIVSAMTVQVILRRIARKLVEKKLGRKYLDAMDDKLVKGLTDLAMPAAVHFAMTHAPGKSLVPGADKVALVCGLAFKGQVIKQGMQVTEIAMDWAAEILPEILELQAEGEKVVKMIAEQVPDLAAEMDKAAGRTGGKELELVRETVEVEEVKAKSVGGDGE